MEKKALLNFIKNRYSREEYIDIVRHFKNDRDFEQLSTLMESQWKKLEGEDLSPSQQIKIHSKLQEQIHLQKLKEDHNISRRLLQFLNKAAAILIIPIILTSLFLFWQHNQSENTEQAYAEIYCPKGTRAKFNLPDGSSGWLNSGSSLKYPVQFKKNRHVELNGEAYFSVEKNKKAPFTVQTHLFNVQVLGTQFNVMSYDDEPFFDVTLESGAVKIHSNNTAHTCELKPNQRFVFDKENVKGYKEDVDTHYYTSWKEGILLFRNTPFSEVMRRLGRWYNVEFTCSDKELLELPYRATFQDETLEHVLELLCLTAPIEYEKLMPKIQNDETYEKQRIHIKRK